MSRADQMPRIELEDLPVEMQDLALETSGDVHGGDAVLTHEGTHASSTQTTTPTPVWPPDKPQPIIAVLIGM